MKKFIPIAISLFLMATPVFFTSCNDEDDLIIDKIGTSQSISSNWIEPYHVKGGSIDEVKHYMTSCMSRYHLISESVNSTNIQLAYSTDDGYEGILYSFDKNTELLYSVVDTELLANSSVVIGFLNANYSRIPLADDAEQQFLYTYTNCDKSVVITTQMVMDGYLNVQYAFVTK